MNNHIKLEKKLCYALRHNPEAFDLVLDDEGFADAEDVCKAFGIERWALESIVEQSDKKRFEIKGDKVRALYGHYIKKRIIKEEIVPPEYLFHGTSMNAAKAIMDEGLSPMNRQYVHLSYKIGTAYEAGKRKERYPVILRIKAKEAYEKGIRFFAGNDNTVLANHIPAEYIKQFVSSSYIIGETPLFKGIFWIVDRKNLENNKPYLFKIVTNRDGYVLAADGELTSKKGNNYNHRTLFSSK